eukprot:4864315-Pyramimonas_sp.AAC.1
MPRRPAPLPPRLLASNLFNNVFRTTTANVTGRAGLECVLGSQDILDGDALAAQEHHFAQVQAWEARLRQLGWSAKGLAAQVTPAGGTTGGLFQMVRRSF